MSEHTDDAARKLSMLATLATSDPFRFFLKQCVDAKLQEADRIMHDKSVSADERTNALHVKLAIREILEWPDEQIRMYENILQRNKP